MAGQSKVAMDATAVGNTYMLSGKATAHPCARCVAFWAQGEHMYLGKVGCIMIRINDGNRDLFRPWVHRGDEDEGVQTMRCLRCFILGQECCSVSRGASPGVSGSLWAMLTHYRFLKI
jgi:hypothetical protein